jgi:hypothetical protein
MTAFTKENIIDNGEYVFYKEAKPENFIARFKHRGPFTKAKFLRELMKNHTVEGYFDEMKAGKAPLKILQDANEDWYYNILEKFSGRKFR